MDMPERIWLQSDGRFEDKDKAVGSVTWCLYGINNTDTEYVRADINAELLEALETACGWMDFVEGYYRCTSDFDRDKAALRAAIAKAKGGKP